MGAAASTSGLQERVSVAWIRDEFGDDADELLADALEERSAARDDDTIAREDLLRWVAGVPRDQTVACSQVVRFDRLARRAPLRELRAQAAAGAPIREMEAQEQRRYNDGDGVLATGENEPRYKVVQFIARGGFGDVYEIAATNDERFALKVIRLEGKTPDERTDALRSLVAETHIALRVSGRSREWGGATSCNN